MNSKSFLYKKVLPKFGIKNVHFRCDGAGCFVGNEVKGNFGIWNEDRTGSVIEVSYKNNVPGKGKTTLDGLFGILTQHLNCLVDDGKGFDSAEELYNLLTDNPIQHTEFHLLNLNQELTDDWEAPRFIRKFKLGRSYYFMLRESNNKAQVFCHSRHGQGKVISFVNPPAKGKRFKNIFTKNLNMIFIQNTYTAALSQVKVNYLRILIQ